MTRFSRIFVKIESLKFLQFYLMKFYLSASTSPSCLEAHAGLFRLLMKGMFDAYVLRTFFVLIRRTNRTISTWQLVQKHKSTKNPLSHFGLIEEMQIFERKTINQFILVKSVNIFQLYVLFNTDQTFNSLKKIMIFLVFAQLFYKFTKATSRNLTLRSLVCRCVVNICSKLETQVMYYIHHCLSGSKLIEYLMQYSSLASFQVGQQHRTNQVHSLDS